MASSTKSRPEFRLWVDKQTSPDWPLLPLVHVTKSFTGNDIVRENQIYPAETADLSLDAQLAFFFYGRPAYRVNGDGAIKSLAACPMAFIFDPELIKEASHIHALDTGAFAARLYQHIFLEEMKVGDFSLEQDHQRPNKLISAVHGSQAAYYDADRNRVRAAEDIASPDHFLVHAYVNLLRSDGRNEPDDRIGTVEVAFDRPVHLDGKLRAVVVPDNLWNEKDKASYLTELSSRGVDVIPFAFRPGRGPDYYFAMIETEVRQFVVPAGAS